MSNLVSMKFLSTILPCVILAANKDGYDVLFGDSKEPYIFKTVHGQKKFGSLNDLIAYAHENKISGAVYVGEEHVGQAIYLRNTLADQATYEKILDNNDYVISPTMTIISRNLDLGNGANA